MKFQQTGINYDDPKYIRQCIDVGNHVTAAEVPEKFLIMAIIEDAYLTATEQKNDCNKKCDCCAIARTNKECAIRFFNSKHFEWLVGNLRINPDYYRKLMKVSDYRKPKRHYKRMATARKEVFVCEKNQGVEDRGDTGLPSETGGAPGTPDLGGALLHREEAGCYSVSGGLCGYGESERVGQGETEL